MIVQLHQNLWVDSPIVNAKSRPETLSIAANTCYKRLPEVVVYVGTLMVSIDWIYHVIK